MGVPASSEYGGATLGGGVGGKAQDLSGSISQKIKKEIVLNLMKLIEAGVINSMYETDLGKDPIEMEPDAGYPFAIVGMPSIASDFEDQASNQRIYRFDILFAVSYQYLIDKNEGVEAIIDAVLNQFDNSFTLEGAATAAALPTEITAFPISTAEKQLVCFVATIKARALYEIS